MTRPRAAVDVSRELSALDVRAVEWVEVRAPGSRTPGFVPGAELQIADDHAPFARALAVELEALGLSARVTSEPSAQIGPVILTAGLVDSSAESVHWRLLAQARSLAPELERRGGTLIFAQGTGGAFRPTGTSAWRGGVSGLAKSAAREWPLATVRVIETCSERGSAAEFAHELLVGGSTLEVGIHQRRVQAVLAPLHEPSLGEPAAGGVFLVTGGARGVTADCVAALAARTRARFALLGRSKRQPWPDEVERTLDLNAVRAGLARAALARGEKTTPAAIDRQSRAALASAEIDRSLAQVAEAGGEGAYYSLDVADPLALAAMIAEVERAWGPITGFIHGAGVLADKRIVDKTEEQFKRVFEPKVLGLANVLQALGTRPLQHIALFSPVAARFGNAGQADYSMANEILNRVAWSLQAAGRARRVFAFNWGPWDGGMVDDGLRRHFAAQGVSLIDRGAGARVFAEILLNGPEHQVELCLGSGLAPRAQ